jgi:hypothetical protein
MGFGQMMPNLEHSARHQKLATDEPTLYMASKSGHNDGKKSTFLGQKRVYTVRIVLLWPSLSSPCVGEWALSNPDRQGQKMLPRSWATPSSNPFGEYCAHPAPAEKTTMSENLRSLSASIGVRRLGATYLYAMRLVGLRATIKVTEAAVKSVLQVPKRKKRKNVHCNAGLARANFSPGQPKPPPIPIS